MATNDRDTSNQVPPDATVNVEHLRRISRGWQAAIVDYTRRNNLLFFKPRSNTVHLDLSKNSQLGGLLTGSTVLLSELCAEEDREKLDKAAASIMKKQQVSIEEIGVSPVYVAIGFLSWVDPDTPTSRTDADQSTNAPVLLLQVELVKKRGQQNQWSLTATGDLQVNGVIKHALEKSGAGPDGLDEDSLSELNSMEMVWAWIEHLIPKLGKLQDAEYQKDAHFAGFSYQDEAIWRDLGDIELLLESVVVRGLAGEGRAISALQQDSFLDPNTFDALPPSNENLVLDADSSQMEAISAAMSGVNVVIEGPPGSGKSQTITNLLAEVLASGKTALFVAQKRAAITAVMDRLEQTGLRDMVLDVHEAHRGAKVAEQIQSSYENMRTALPPNPKLVHKDLSESRRKLAKYREACFDNNRPLGMSLIELRQLAFSPDAEGLGEIDAPIESVEKLNQLSVLEELVETLVITGGVDKNFLVSRDTFSVVKITTDEDLDRAIEAVDAMTPSDEETIAHFVSQLPEGPNYDTGASVENLFSSLTFFAALLRLAVKRPKALRKRPDLELLSLMATTHNIETSKSLPLATRFRGLRAAVFLFGMDRSSRTRGVDDLQLVSAFSDWSGVLPENFHKLDIAKLEQLCQKILAIKKLIQGFDLARTPLDSVLDHLRQISRDAGMYRVPRFYEAEAKCIELGFPNLVESLRGIGFDVSQTQRGQGAVRAAVGQKLYADALRKDDRLKGLTGDQLARFVQKFRDADIAHLNQNAGVVRRVAAETFKEARDLNPAEDRFLLSEYQRKRAHKPLRVLAAKAPNLMLAANPIWAMSPIQVSNYLPRGIKFDYVIFDEASQIKPEVAIPALVRGRTVIVAGDSNQLPPTDFFSGASFEAEVSGLDEADGDLSESTVSDSESILEAMERIVGQQKRRLNWHYRSRDERLIAVSNMEIYGSSLTTFPASDTPDALEHVVVDSGPHAKTAMRTQNNEVDRVLAIALDHVKNRPEQSMGIITFGMKHLKPLEFAFANLESTNPKFREWVDSKAGHEPFFVKNLERVQGDERDHIIISTGYGKNAAGQLQMHWGPLTGVPGRRRLNVAISRSKRKMTLVTSFTVAELEAKNIRPGTGAELFRKFMEFLDNDGAHYRGATEPEPLNSFELDIKAKLEKAGVHTETQHGVGNYRIDFVVPDERKPGQYLLAIEADGASYHSSLVARERDRLRQELLEARGWNFHRIWSTDWFSNPQQEVDKVLAALDRLKKWNPTKPMKKADPTRQVSAPAEVLRAARPLFALKDKIDEYSDETIRRLIEWVRSDGALRTNEEIIGEARAELGFKRDGARIRDRLERLI